MKQIRKNRVLLVGTSYSAAPLLLGLRNMGFQVSVCGTNRADPCVALADDYYQFDYADRDALLTAVRKERFAYICPSCNDYAYLSAAYVANILELPGYDSLETAYLLHDKAIFREFTSTHGIPAPRAVRFKKGETRLPKNLTAPLLMKPIDAFSGRGIAKLTNARNLAQSARRALSESRSSEVLVEEFVEGSLHSHSAFLRNGKVVQDFFVDEYCQVYPYQVDCSNFPSRLSRTVRATVRRVVDELQATLKLADGLLHTQFVVNGSRVAIIECMRRCPGDLYYHLIGFATGVDYIANYIAPFVNKPVVASDPRRRGNWVRHTVSFPRDTVFWSMAANLSDAEVVTFPLAESADTIQCAPYGKAAILFAKFNSRDRMFEIAPKIRQQLFITETPANHE